MVWPYKLSNWLKEGVGALFLKIFNINQTDNLVTQYCHKNQATVFCYSPSTLSINPRRLTFTMLSLGSCARCLRKCDIKTLRLFLLK